MDISRLSKQELASFIVYNPHLLEKMEEDDLLKIYETINPYAYTAEENNKFTVVSITNFKSEYWRAFKTLSLLKFLGQLTTESADWAARAGIPEHEHELFAKHLAAFKNYFLTYNPEKDVRDSKHTSADTATPPQDFFHRWQRFEDQNTESLHKDVYGVYDYRLKYYAAVQVYDTFATEQEAQEYVQRHSQTVGVDMLVGQTNKWLIIQDNEEFLEKTFYTDDDEKLLTSLIEQMRKDARLGEDMIKKRVEHKKKESEAKTGPVPEEAKALLNHKNTTYKNNRLEMAELPDGCSVNVPVLISGPTEISKQII